MSDSSSRQSRRALVVLNPTSGLHDPASTRRSLRGALEGAGWEVEIAETRPDLDAASIVRTAVARDTYGCVVAAGGDGTVMGTVQGLWDAGDGRRAKLPLAVAPLGTGNGLASTLGIRGAPGDAVVRSLAGRRSRIDLGLFVDRQRVFTVFAGAGLDADVMRSADRKAKNRFGPLAYLGAAVQQSFRQRRRSIRLELDDRVLEVDAHTVMAFNASGRILAGLPLGPAADPQDGRFDVLVLDGNAGFETLAELFEVATLGDATADRHDVVTRVRRLRVDADPALAAHADGDPVGFTPMELEVRPGALDVWVPAPPVAAT